MMMPLRPIGSIGTKLQWDPARRWGKVGVVRLPVLRLGLGMPVGAAARSRRALHPRAVRRGRHRRHARNRTAEVRCARPCVARTSHAPAGPAFTPSRPYL